MTSAADRPQPASSLTFADLGPLMAETIARWHHAEDGIDDWDSACRAVPPRWTSGWAALAEHLQLVNTFQWHEEDRSRDQAADDAVLAAVKRSIDASNRRRVQAVDRLDDLIHTDLAAAGVIDPDAPLNSESPGSIVDRLSVLALKIFHIEEALAGAGGDRGAMQTRLAGLQEQSEDLGRCLDRLLADIRAGRRGLKLYRQVKVYREAASGRLKADLD